MPDDKKPPSMAMKIFGEVKELVKAEVDQLRADTKRLDFLAKHPEELVVVHDYWKQRATEIDVREAIDARMYERRDG